jgi:hypothetical protein
MGTEGMITEPVRIVSDRHLRGLRASLRRFRWGFGLVVCLAVALGVSAAGRPDNAGRPSWGPVVPWSVPPEGSANARAICQHWPSPAAVDDPLYDRYLQQYEPLRDDAEGRRYVVAHVLAAAALHRLDPDLLFALIGAEPGLAGRAVRPKAVRAAAQRGGRAGTELYDMPRSLSATALRLRQVLRKAEGDLGSVLRAHYAGLSNGSAKESEQDQYVASASARYAYLKAKRTYYCLSTAPAG